MAISNPTITTITDPQLWDYVLSPFQIALEGGLTWLGAAYGKAERRTRERDGLQIIYPAVYANAKDYLNVMPDGHLGNFTFFNIQDGWDVQTLSRRFRVLNATASLIGWYDFRTIYPLDWEERTNQHVIFAVLDAIRYTTAAGMSWEVIQIWEQGPNIYEGFSSPEIDNQYLMRPYGGFRIDIQISFDENCT